MCFFLSKFQFKGSHQRTANWRTPEFGLNKPKGHFLSSAPSLISTQAQVCLCLFAGNAGKLSFVLPRIFLKNVLFDMII